MGEKPKFAYDRAIDVASEICNALELHCERLLVAGSLRRRKPEVGDVEILYIPKYAPGDLPGELFGGAVNFADRIIGEMELNHILTKRSNINGIEVFGEKNKLMRHTLSRIPVDLFSATVENWWNQVVCRTGPAALNIKIASLAQDGGYKWNVYGAGFTRLSDREIIPMESERAVFEFVNLPYLEPWERVA